MQENSPKIFLIIEPFLTVSLSRHIQYLFFFASTPDINQGIESHDGMDTMVSTLRVEREQNGTEVSPSMVREQSNRSREGYNLKSKADENRAASKQLSQTNDSPDRDISDKFQQER